jgi:hypothetical protein
VIVQRAVPVLAAISVLLGACATTPSGERMTWAYVEGSKAEGPKLAFGVAHTDELSVVFFCDPSTDFVAFDVPAALELSTGSATLKSGAVARVYDSMATLEVDPYEVLHFKTGRRDPVLKAFATSGRLALDVHDGFVPHDAKTTAERAAVARFAKACGMG